MRSKKRAMYFKIIISAVVAIGLLNWAFIEIDSSRRQEDLETFALAYAHAGVARALSRADTSAFLRIRDSIASELGVSAEMALDFSETFQGAEYELAVFWKKVRRITDSIVALYQKSPTDSSEQSSGHDAFPDSLDSGKSAQSSADLIDILIKNVGDTS